MELDLSADEMRYSVFRSAEATVFLGLCDACCHNHFQFRLPSPPPPPPPHHFPVAPALFWCCRKVGFLSENRNCLKVVAEGSYLGSRDSRSSWMNHELYYFFFIPLHFTFADQSRLLTPLFFICLLMYYEFTRWMTLNY